MSRRSLRAAALATAFATARAAALAAVALATFAAASPAQLVPNGATWKYLDDGSDPGPAWTSLSYSDASWSAGPAELGYGDGDEATVVGYGPNAAAKYPTTYFRHEFQVPNPSLIQQLHLRYLRDDGLIVYLNGTEIERNNLPAGPVGHLDWAASVINGAGEVGRLELAVDPGLLLPGRNLLAVELHQAAPDDPDLSLALELTELPLPPLARGPYLQKATPTSMVVRWNTRAATDSVVRWGATPTSLNQSLVLAGARQQHELEITGLQPDTLYYYAVGDSLATYAGGDPEHRFRTFPPAGAARAGRIWVIGDSGTARGGAAAVRDAYAAFSAGLETDLWLMLGDNAYVSGTPLEYQAAVFDMYPAMLRSAPLFATRGNHEKSAPTYYGQFSFPARGEAGGLPSGSEAYYSFDFANVHFVCLDSEASSRAPGGPMLTWLEQDLAATAQDWIVAYWHHPPYTKGSHDSDDPADSGGRMKEMREHVLPILEDYGVDLVLAGHSHSYERSFLIDGHYGDSASFDPLSMLLDGGDGSVSGTGAYQKAAGGHAGAVYTVAGCSGKRSGGPLDHPVMYRSLDTLGSVVLEVDGGRLDLRFLDATGAVSDECTLLRRSPGPQLQVLNLVAGQQASARLSQMVPGNLAVLGWSVSGGGPVATHHGDVLLSPPVHRLGPAVADPNGQLSVSLTVPAGSAGLPIWVHALELSGGGQGWLSNALALTIQ